MSETMPDTSLPALPGNPDPEPPPAVTPEPAAPAAPVTAPPAAPVTPPAAPVEPAAAPPAAPPPPAPNMVIDLPEWLREGAAPAATPPVVTPPPPPPPPAVTAPAAGVVTAPAVPPVVSALALELAQELMGPPNADDSPEQQAALVAATSTLAGKLEQFVTHAANARAASVYDERANQVQQTIDLHTRSAGAQEAFRSSLYGSLPAYAPFRGTYVEREIIAPEAVAELRRHGVQNEEQLAALDAATFQAISRNIITRIAFRFGTNAETLAEHAAWVAANPGAVPTAPVVAAAPGAPAAAATTVPVGGSAGAVPPAPRVAATGGFVPQGGVQPRGTPLEAEAADRAELRKYMSETEGI